MTSRYCLRNYQNILSSVFNEEEDEQLRHSQARKILGRKAKLIIAPSAMKEKVNLQEAAINALHVRVHSDKMLVD